MTRRLTLLLVALALVAGGCGSRVRQEEWDALASPDGSPTPTTLRASTSGDDAVTETAATLPPSRARQANGHGGTATTTNGALPAPADGDYVYDETDEDGVQSTSTERWSAQRGADSVTVTSQVVERDEDTTTTSTETYRVTHDAYVLLRDRTDYSDDPENPDDCTYKPPVLLLQLPLKVGSKWESVDACDDEDPADADHSHVQVTDTATDVIGGTSIATFVVKEVYSFDSTDETTGERTTYTETDVRHIDPATLMILVEDSTATEGKQTYTDHRRLRSLTPT